MDDLSDATDGGHFLIVCDVGKSPSESGEVPSENTLGDVWAKK